MVDSIPGGMVEMPVDMFFKIMESSSDTEKLHQIKLLAQDWYDGDGDESEPSAWWIAEELLKIVDPGNERIKPPVPPTPEQIAASETYYRKLHESISARLEADQAAFMEFDRATNPDQIDPGLVKGRPME